MFIKYCVFPKKKIKFFSTLPDLWVTDQPVSCPANTNTDTTEGNAADQYTHRQNQSQEYIYFEILQYLMNTLLRQMHQTMTKHTLVNQSMSQPVNQSMS